MSITVRGQMCTIRPGNLEVPYGAPVSVHVPGFGVWMSRDRPPLSAPPPLAHGSALRVRTRPGVYRGASGTRRGRGGGAARTAASDTPGRPLAVQLRPIQQVRGEALQQQVGRGERKGMGRDATCPPCPTPPGPLLIAAGNWARRAAPWPLKRHVPQHEV